MEYWNEVKRIQNFLKAGLVIGTAEATEIINRITGKLGYFFAVNSIYHTIKREEVFNMLAEIKKSGKQPEMVAMLKSHYAGQTGEYVTAEDLTNDEIVQSAAILEGVIRQLEAEAKEYVRQKKTPSANIKG